MVSRRWSFLAPLLTLLIVLSMAAPVLTRAQDERHGLDPADMDLTVDPRQDFYRFANGGWLDRTEIPADESSYGVFNELFDLTQEQLFSLLDEVANSDTLVEGSDEWKAAELYRQGMDMATRNAKGVAPIQPLLDEIDAISTLEEFHEFQQTAEFSWLTGLFWLFVMPGFDDSSVNDAYLSSSFLGLPNRDYYLEDDEGNAEVREAYIATNARLLEFAGYDPAQAEAAAQAVYDLERSLAEPTLTREEEQDLSLSNNPTTIADLQTIYPLMDWEGYLADLGITGIEEINVTQLRYLEALEQIVRDTPLDVLKDFLKVEVMWSFANFLGEDIGQTAFEFRSVLSGVEEQRPLEERTLNQVSSMLGEAVGRLYVEEYFPPEAKAEITALVDALIVAFRGRLEANTWMSPETKEKALEKLAAMDVKVGYPDQWRSYEAVEIGDSYFDSFLSAVNADTRRNLDKAGEPVDREEWDGIVPQEVNAFYDAFTNSIVFPAAILQAPFFDYQADPAVNFGGIGMVIGHEITHGFDLQGSQFDAQGNLNNWWTDEDLARFEELNQLVVDQYGAIELIPGLPIDGQITVTENVADLGGAQVAYDALEVYLTAQGEAAVLASPIATPVVVPDLATPAPAAMASPALSPVASPVAVVTVFADLTPQQRFFISAATIWRELLRDESLELQIRTDSHAPAVLRGTLPIRNMDEFHEAFGTEPGDDMYLPPAERFVIW